MIFSCQIWQSEPLHDFASQNTESQGNLTITLDNHFWTTYIHHQHTDAIFCMSNVC